MPLLTFNNLPPGGWFYEQFDAAGKSLKKFHTNGPFNDFCGEVLAMRAGNLLPGADLATVKRDVEAYQCTRLGNDPRFCRANSGPVTRSVSTFLAVAAPGCSTCGGQKA
jgi:hypothetical protein